MAEAALAEALPSRRERRRLEVRDRIVETALSLFETQGYEATTVNEIAKHADIAYGTFFNHFPSKLDLLRDISNRSLRELFESLSEIPHEQGAFGQQLVRLFEDAATSAEAKGAKMRELVGAMMTLSLPESAVSDDLEIRIAFRQFLEQGVAVGDLGADADLDTLTDVVVGTWYSMFISWVHFDDYPLRERASSAAHFLSGALTASCKGANELS